MDSPFQPGLSWYKQQSKLAGVLPRCPFAALERCPRFFQSISLLGEAGVATALKPEEDHRLMTAWEKSELWPRTNEHASSVMGPSDDPRHFRNFCPEVSFERFGLFAANLSRHADEVDAEVAHRRLSAAKAPGSDWRWRWSWAEPMHYTDCPLYSPLMGRPIERPTVEASVPNMTTADLDPFRVAMSVIDDSDVLVSASNAAGLQVDLALDEREALSHKTRIRALLPRVIRAYESLDAELRMVAARAAVGEIRRTGPALEAAVSRALDAAGWELRDSGFVVRSEATREAFFPRDSQWDAFVVLRGILAEAKQSVTIVDAYCNENIFPMLSAETKNLKVEILCSRYAPAVAAEAKAFMAQHPGVAIEVRATQDFHDRFVVIDGTACVHIGASIKDAGRTAFMVSRVEDDDNRTAILNAVAGSWAAGKPLT